ncbi:MAG: OmpA family protein [Flavobacteriales bacterium]
MNKTPIILLVAFTWSGCAKMHLASADKHYERMAFAKAACDYERADLGMTDRVSALRAAESYEHQNMLPKAADWYAFSERIEPLDVDHALRYAQVLQGLGRTMEAMKQYEKVHTARPDDAVATEQLRALEERNTFYVDTTLFTVSLVQLEGLASVFSATPLGNSIVFAAEKSPSAGNENPWTGQSFLDLFSSTPSASGTWSTPVPLPGTVNGRFHEGPAVFSADGKVMYFTRSDYYKFRLNKDGNAVSHLKLFRAQRDANGAWSDIRQFAYNGDEYSTGHAALSADGNKLYFISDRPGGLGGTDIYRCTRLDSTWSAPINLGPTVNTAGNEMFPTLAGDTLYFASNGHRTLGGLDIFRSVPEGEGWSTPENLNYPINTPADDFSFVLLPDGENGYLSSNRNGTDRVYSFAMHEPTLALKGVFLDDEESLPMADVEVKFLDITTGEEIVLFTGPEGSYYHPLKKNHSYRVSGGKDGMFTESRDLSTSGQRTSRTWTEDFFLKRVVIDKPILVQNIYYDYDKWDIRPDAAIELDKLARLFTDNPDLSFELGSHTDSRASDVYNIVLSEARANSAVDYLIRKGVDPHRITAKGYGETRLVNRCANDVECSEEEHQANRRTEFKVTKVNGPLP